MRPITFQSEIQYLPVNCEVFTYYSCTSGTSAHANQEKLCNPQRGFAQMWLWSVQGSSQALAWTPQSWFAALPSGGLIRYCSLY